MAIYAYLRVSTDAQDTANQKHGILEFANARGLAGLQFTEDSASGRVPWQERKLGELVAKTQPGDVLIFAEVSRIARSTLGVLEVLKICQEKDVSVLIAKQKMEFDSSLNSKISAIVLGLAAEIEREFLSLRTKEALAQRQQQIAEHGQFTSKAGAVRKSLGRPEGRAETVKLDAKEKEIRDYLAKGINKRDIAKLVECAPSTLYDWLSRKGIKTGKKAAA